MKKIRTFLRLRTQILGMLRYSLNEVTDYKYLTKKEKSILSEKDFWELRELSGCIRVV